MKIYGDTNSGNCLKVKWVCDALALPYGWIDVDTRKRETRTAPFLKMNSAGQVPVIEFDDGRVLAESNAIIRYLARGSDLIPADAFAAAKMDEWLFCPAVPMRSTGIKGGFNVVLVWLPVMETVLTISACPSATPPNI